MIPALREIVEGADYMEQVPLTKERTDGIVRFHWLETTVELAGELLRVGVQIGEDGQGRKFFNLNQDMDAWAARYGDAGGSGVDSGRRRSPKPESFNQDISPADDGLNIDLSQDTPEGPRGSITFGEGRTLVRLFENADLSTVLHESGHLFFEVMQRLEKRPEASDRPGVLGTDYGSQHKSAADLSDEHTPQ